MSAPRPGWQLRPCGTPAACRRHRRRGETPCEPCQKAEALASAEWREQHPEYVAARTEARRDRYRAARAAGFGSRQARLAMASPARLEQLLAGAS